MKHNLFEGLGLLILLFSFGVQQYLEGLRDLGADNSLIWINENILYSSRNDEDIIKFLAHPENYNRYDVINTISNRNNNLYTWGHVRDQVKYLKQQESNSTNIFLFFYIIGSIMIIMPKLFPNSCLFKKEDKDSNLSSHR